MVVKLKPDAALRRKFMVPESFAHPAKMHAGLVWEILERCTLSGQWILDPMSGSGTTLNAGVRDAGAGDGEGMTSPSGCLPTWRASSSG